MSVQPFPTALQAEQDLPSIHSPQLIELAEAIVNDIEGADHAVVTEAGQHHVLAATSAIAEQLDAAQRSTGAGPSVDAEHSGKIERINYLSDHAWPEFEQVCSRSAIRSVAAFPIHAGADTVGVLTVYSSDHHAFGAPELRMGRVVADAMAPLLRRVGAHGRQ